ncbi:MAG: ABC transporter substrate-binding protein [Cyanobacteriota bacterium]|nr:ABC transporter substrate-binding protein [Cyanobacteriota bacterium]
MIIPGELLHDRYRVIELLDDTGFGQTWEVTDGGMPKIMKVLKTPKVLDNEHIEKAICLFAEEAKVLSQVKGPGLPEVEESGYFCLSEKGGDRHQCLVMEKIAGSNLESWLKENNKKPIEEARAIAWLTQLVQIIGQLHQFHYIHRDLKPDNIILRSSPPHQKDNEFAIVEAIAPKTKNSAESGLSHSQQESKPKPPESAVEEGENTPTVQAGAEKWGQLALIEFGACREVTETYLREVEGKDVTGMMSRDYSAPEQYEGKAVRQSDFFAIARIIVYLLTAEHPQDLPYDPQTGRVMWRKRRPKLSRDLADLLDEMMASLPQSRPQTTEEILEILALLQAEQPPPSAEADDKKPEPKKDTPAEQDRSRSVGDAISLPSLPRRVKLPSLKKKSTNNRKVQEGGQQRNSLAILAVIGALLAILPEGRTICPVKFEDDLSCGEEILIPGSALEAKQQAVKAFAERNYADAVDLLETARLQQGNDPETLIYLNNAKLAAQNADAYTVAVVAPLEGDTQALNSGMEILRGVAQAQDAINKSDAKIGGKGLLVIIADDGNDPDKAVRKAEYLGSIGQVLGVVGHFSSDVSLIVAPVYEENELVAVSPTSTSALLSERNNFFFRTVPSDAVTARALASYLQDRPGGLEKVATFYNPNSAYSESIQNQFINNLTAVGGTVLTNNDGRFDFSRTSFNASAAVQLAKEREVNALAIFPNSFTRAEAIEVVKANDEFNFPIVAGDSVYNEYTLKFGGAEAANNLAIATPWISLNSPNPTFPTEAENLWGGSVSWRTAFAYDATRVLITALESLPKQQELTKRIAVKNALADENFSSYGATGEIHFLVNGDRKESRIDFARIVPSKCSPFGYSFIPLDYPVDELEGKNCD